MNDTRPEIAKMVIEMFQKKTPLERAKMGWSMYETSKYLITRAILQENPNISAVELKQELFLKFYRNDFTPEQREKILAHLARVGGE